VFWVHFFCLLALQLVFSVLKWLRCECVYELFLCTFEMDLLFFVHWSAIILIKGCQILNFKIVDINSLATLPTFSTASSKTCYCTTLSQFNRVLILTTYIPKFSYYSTVSSAFHISAFEQVFTSKFFMCSFFSLSWVKEQGCSSSNTFNLHVLVPSSNIVQHSAFILTGVFCCYVLSVQASAVFLPQLRPHCSFHILTNLFFTVILPFDAV
jgi:hypothetical protein